MGGFEALRCRAGSRDRGERREVEVLAEPPSPGCSCRSRVSPALLRTETFAGLRGGQGGVPSLQWYSQWSYWSR